MMKLLILFYIATPIYECQEATLFNFNTNNDISKWSEQSDTLLPMGQSKAALLVQTSAQRQRAVFFTLLNPSGGGCFAGCRRTVSWNLSKFTRFALNIRGQGQNFIYKIVLRDFYTQEFTYEQMFQAPLKTFDVVYLPFNRFAPFFRGRRVNTNTTLVESYIVNFGFQMACGIFSTVKQQGVSSLEINWVKVFN